MMVYICVFIVTQCFTEGTTGYALSLVEISAFLQFIHMLADGYHCFNSLNSNNLTSFLFILDP